MITAIRRLGNSRGIIIPKPMLKEAGLDEEAEIALERGAIVLRKPRRNPSPGLGGSQPQIGRSRR